MDDNSQSRNVQRICPVISNAIRYEMRDKKGKPQKINEIAECSCLLGRCILYDIGKGKCGLLQ